MTIWTLIQTDNDTSDPVTVSVYLTKKEAVAIARHDIEANGTEIVEEYDEPDKWGVIHTESNGYEHQSIVEAHHLKGGDE